MVQCQKSIATASRDQRAHHPLKGQGPGVSRTDTDSKGWNVASCTSWRFPEFESPGAYMTTTTFFSRLFTKMMDETKNGNGEREGDQQRGLI